jgi:hypothetical protein
MMACKSCEEEKKRKIRNERLWGLFLFTLAVSTAMYTSMYDLRALYTFLCGLISVLSGMMIMKEDK